MNTANTVGQSLSPRSLHRRFQRFFVAFMAVLVMGATSAVVTATPAWAATANPTNVTATAGNAQVTISWTPSTTTSVDNYTVTSTPTSAGCTVTGQAATSCIVPGLTNGTSYTFTVVAVDTAPHAADSSGVTTAAVTPRTVPGAPTGVVATVANAQSVVSWT
ncbi:MAG: fibronectin type III domain-containing protein, partial [Actinomycetes bacterium]